MTSRLSSLQTLRSGAFWITVAVLIWVVESSKLEHWTHPELQGAIESSALEAASRHPKFFLGTTTTVTSTLSTTTACFTSNAALNVACSRRRRRKLDINSQPLPDSVSPSLILPSSTFSRADDDRDQETARDLNQLAHIKSGKISAAAEPRFLFYFYTTTVTSTFTTFTKTTTFSLTVCSPASFVYAACG